MKRAGATEMERESERYTSFYDFVRLGQKRVPIYSDRGATIHPRGLSLGEFSSFRVLPLVAKPWGMTLERTT